MSADRARPDWEVTVKPRLTPVLAWVVAGLTVTTGIAIALTLRITSTGPILRVADQVSMVGLSVVLAGAVLLLTRPRLKAGPAGLAVRNVLGYRFIPWDEVVDVSFPHGKKWARVDLDFDEYVPVLAIQANDRERAVAAMEAVRELMDRYR